MAESLDPKVVAQIVSGEMNNDSIFGAVRLYAEVINNAGLIICRPDSTTTEETVKQVLFKE